MKTEIVLAVIGNLIELGQIIFFLSPFGFIILLIVNSVENGIELYQNHVKKIIVIISISGIVGCFPSMEDLWKVRINLIKLELASPENVSKGVDEIGRIAERLECKYLGCEEKK